MTAIATYTDLTPDAFRDIVAQAQPALLKGVVADWPAVKAAQSSDRDVADYIKRFDSGKPAEVWLGEPQIQGQFFYGDSLDKLNFRKAPATLSATLDHLLSLADQNNPPSVYIQSTAVSAYLPDFTADNRLKLLPDVPPRLWVGNRLRVQTHYDPVDNIACVVAGRRRFTLFPPQQVVNLYVGPFEKTVAGAPVSMAPIENPDFDRFPRLREALDHAVTVELEPGDGLFIPYFWWHHVQSLSAFNILVNYWWDEQPHQNAEAMDAFLHAVLALRDLSPARRDIWKTMFEHYVFQANGDPMAHLPPADRGALGPMSGDALGQARRRLVERLFSRWAPPRRS
jgi:hypothetical protein